MLSVAEASLGEATLLQPVIPSIKIHICASIVSPVLRALIGAEMCVGLG